MSVRKSRGRERALLAGIGAAFAMLLGPGVGEADLAGQSRLWRPDDRALIGAFHLILSVTRSDRDIYALSDRALLVLDASSRRWAVPSTAEDGFPTDEEPRAIAWHPGRRALFLGTLAGGLWSWRPEVGRWDRESVSLPGPVLALRADERSSDDRLWVRVPGGWYSVELFSGIAEPVDRGGLPFEARLSELGPEERLARLEPGYAALRGTLTLQGGRSWPLTDFVEGNGAGEYWIGTAGNGIYRYDARFGRAEHYPFGTLTTGVPAMAASDGQIWFGGDGLEPRPGLTRARDGLGSWSWFPARQGLGPATRTEALLATGRTLWIGTVTGLERMDLGSERRERVAGLAGGVRVHRVVPGRGGEVWVATERGAVRFDSTGTPLGVLLPGERIEAVLPLGETVLLAGRLGLRRSTLEGDLLGWGEGPPPPPDPVLDLALVRDTVWAATAGALWHWSGAGWQGPLRGPVQGGVGRIARLVGDASGRLWVGGDGGVAVRAPGAVLEWEFLLAGADLPDYPVLDLLPLDRDLLWVGTRAGAFRLNWRPR